MKYQMNIILMLFCTTFVSSCSIITSFRKFRDTDTPITLCTPANLVVISKTLDYSLALESIEAIKYWNKILKHLVGFVYAGPISNIDIREYGSSGYFIIAEATDRMEREWKQNKVAKFSPTYSNRGCLSGGKIYLRQSILISFRNLSKIQTAIRHEFGHVVGFGHNGIPGTLMYKQLLDYGHPVGLNKDDIRRVRNLYNFRSKYRDGSLIREAVLNL